MTKFKGFTLIELLIVVAIIAILAAIAVPNFLEAQVRSKVSRVHADMRTLATAIESYRIDYNDYPIASQYIFGPTAPQPVTFNNRLRGITTPVAYMTSLPPDPFNRTVNQFPVTPGQDPTYEYLDYHSAVFGQLIPGLGTFAIFGNQAAMNKFYGEGGRVFWAMHSPGPDQVSDFNTIPLSIQEANARELGTNATYDPTNGTVSHGDIVRSNVSIRD